MISSAINYDVIYNMAIVLIYILPILNNLSKFEELSLCRLFCQREKKKWTSNTSGLKRTEDISYYMSHTRESCDIYTVIQVLDSL